jgi:hypothetical protein
VSEVAARERRLWLLDQKINNQGFLVDLDLADAASKASKLRICKKSH